MENKAWVVYHKSQACRCNQLCMHVCLPSTTTAIPKRLNDPDRAGLRSAHPPKSMSGHVSWVFPRGEPGSHSTVPCIPK